MSIFKLDINYRNIMILVIAAFVLFLMYRIQPIISVFAFSFFIAYLLDPVIDKMEAAKIPRALGIIILIFIITIILTIFILSVMPLLYSEMKYLADTAPKTIVSIIDMAEKFAARLNVDISMENIKATLAPKAGQIAQNLLSATGSIAASAMSAISTIVNLALIPVLVFYFLKDFDTMSDKFFATVQKKGGKDYKKYMLDFNQILSVYFRGQVIVAGILAVLYTTVLLICGVKPAILIGLVSGILSIVPYLGFIIGFAASLILAAVQHQDILHPVMVIIGFAIVQVLEGNVITPKIVGESLGLHPTAVIFALLTGGSLLGIGGMIIALPVAAFIKILAMKQLGDA